MKIYRVGGSVRDELMGLKPHDNDYVVVGSTPTEMESLGYKQVGKDFPVYLHPDTNEEYALARTERKSGLKHTDFETYFDPSVTIEEDLIRRDLTMNAIAISIDTHEIIDPYNGVEDIKNGVLRHISDAFGEDPLRVLRVARFTARFPRFDIAAETSILMKNIVDNGDLNHISPERIWEETKKAFLSSSPYNYLQCLNSIGALKILNLHTFSYKINTPAFIKIMNRLWYYTELMPNNNDNRLMIRVAVIYDSLSNWGDGNEELLKIPNHIMDFISFVNKYAYNLTHSMHFSPNAIISIMDEMNIKSKLQKFPNLLEMLLDVCDTLYPTEDSQPLDHGRNIRKFIRLVPAYFDTQHSLKFYMDDYEKYHNKPMPPDRIKTELNSIRISNIIKILNSHD